MIPKIIHYSWISDDPYPPLIQRCMDSWKKYAPDYQMVRWDKNRFDIDSLQFTKEAYIMKKWAFISDVQRLHALYHFGGIYLDTDVELVKPLDDLLFQKAFIGYHHGDRIQMWVLGFEKGNPWIKRMLDYYNERPFIRTDGSVDDEPNTFIVTNLSEQEFGFRIADKPDYLAGDIRIYPVHYFDPPVLLPGNRGLSPETYAIHHYNGAWKSEELQKKERLNKRIQKAKNFIRLIIGSRIAEKLGSLKRLFLPNKKRA